MFLLHFDPKQSQLEHLFLTHFPEQQSESNLHLLLIGLPHLRAFGHLEHFLLLQSLFLKQEHVLGYLLRVLRPPRGPLSKTKLIPGSEIT